MLHSFFMLLMVLTILVWTWSYPLVSSTTYCWRNKFHRIIQRSTSTSQLYVTPKKPKKSVVANDKSSSASAAGADEDQDQELKKQALELLDCLTSPKDMEDPQFDITKDMRRDEIMQNNDYSSLKVALRERGLRTSGDQMEMIVRLLLHVIDPSINYSQMTGKEVNLQYIDKEDVSSNKVKLIPEGQRESDPSDSDADDMMALRRRPGRTEKPKIVMDGLTRRELEFLPLRVTRPLSSTSIQEDEKTTIRAYIVGGRDVLRTWERHATVIVLLPDETGWRDKNVRIFADELSFFNQAIVVVPDLYRGQSMPWTDSNNSSSTESYEQWLTQQRFDRIFDDIVSTLQFSTQHFDCRSLSLAGIGCGGGWALQAACALSDIQSAAAVASLSEQREGSEGGRRRAGIKPFASADDAEFSVNPFAEPRNSLNLANPAMNPEAKMQAQLQMTERMMANMAKAAGVGAVAETDSESVSSSPEIEVDLAAGTARVEDWGGDINRLLSMNSDADASDVTRKESGDESNGDTVDGTQVKSDTSAPPEAVDPHAVLEAHRKALDSDMASRALEIATRRAQDVTDRSLVADYAALTLRDLAKLEPRALLVVCPTCTTSNAALTSTCGTWDEIGQSLRIPTCLVFGENDNRPGARYVHQREKAFTYVVVYDHVHSPMS